MSKTGRQALPKVSRSMKEISPMEDKKIYLLVESTVLPADIGPPGDEVHSF